MSIDIDKLEALAKEASEGPWFLHDEGDLLEVQSESIGIVSAVYDTSSDPERLADLPNLEYIATANPSAILALITRLREAEQREQELAAHVERQSKIIFDALAAIEDGDVNAAPFDEARAAHNETPVTRLKAQWQAEALHDLLMHPREATLRKRACDMRDELRRQAEQGDNLQANKENSNE